MKIGQWIDDIIKREGRYANDMNDSGGETAWGITVAVARAFGYHGAMSIMPESVARAIYIERYWLQPRFDQVAEISELVAEEMLDTGVNMGAGRAGVFLQRALNVLNQRGKHYPDIAADGAIGKMTLAALKAYLLKRGKEGEAVLVQMLNSQQSVKYIEFAEAKDSQEDFEYGWQANRVASALGA